MNLITCAKPFGVEMRARFKHECGGSRGGVQLLEVAFECHQKFLRVICEIYACTPSRDTAGKEVSESSPEVCYRMHSLTSTEARAAHHISRYVCKYYF